jgi:hypothetical protein
MVNVDGEPVQLAYPLARVGTDVATVTQDTPEHVMAQVNVVVRYPVGYLGDEPDFGIPWPDFAIAPVDPQPIVDAIEAQVPDAAGIAFTEYADAVGAAIRDVELDIFS